MNHIEQIIHDVGKLRICRVRFELEAQQKCTLPEYLGSTLRGALAMATKRMVCTHNFRFCDGCPVQRTCHYPFLFETVNATGTQPIKRARDFPHPLVIEPPLTHKRLYQPGDKLTFQIVLYGKGINSLPYLIFAVNDMAQYGLGVKKSLFRLNKVLDCDQQVIYDPLTGVMQNQARVYTIHDIWNHTSPPNSLTIKLITPLRTKSDGKWVNDSIDIEYFLRSLCRRINSLLIGYEDSEGLDFTPLLQQTMPEIKESNLRWKPLERYSNRQKSKLKIGGLIGSFQVEGNLNLWWLLLLAAPDVHIGKGTVMGLGQIALEVNLNPWELSISQNKTAISEKSLNV